MLENASQGIARYFNASQERLNVPSWVCSIAACGWAYSVKSPMPYRSGEEIWIEASISEEIRYHSSQKEQLTQSSVLRITRSHCARSTCAHVTVFIPMKSEKNLTAGEVIVPFCEQVDQPVIGMSVNDCPSL